jgi:hypothetical protein
LWYLYIDSQVIINLENNSILFYLQIKNLIKKAIMPTTVTEFIQDRAGKMTFEMSDGSVKTFDPSVTTSSGAVGPVVRAVGNRCSPPNAKAGSNTQLFAISKQFATTDLNSLSLVLSAWYLSTNAELNAGADVTYTCSVEYPIGTTPTRLTFAGANSGVCFDGGNIATDLVSLPTGIPKGAAYFIRVYGVFPSGILYHSNYGLNDTNGSVPDSGETWVFGNSVTDLTGSTTIPACTQAGITFRPTAVLGYSTIPAVFILADSRGGVSIGNDQPTDAFGLIGEVERIAGQSVGLINCSFAGEKLQTALGVFTKRATLLQYCTHVIGCEGINDLSNGRTSAQVLADISSFRNLIPAALPLYWTTLPPWTTDSAGAVPISWNAQRTALNTKIRKGARPLAGCVEIADLVESSRDSGAWKTGYTSDGIHENPAGGAAISAGGRVVFIGG